MNQSNESKPVLQLTLYDVGCNCFGSFFTFTTDKQNALYGPEK